MIARRTAGSDGYGSGPSVTLRSNDLIPHKMRNITGDLEDVNALFWPNEPAGPLTLVGRGRPDHARDCLS